VKDFAREFFRAFGAQVKQRRRGIEVTLDGELAQHFGRERLDLIFDAGHLQPGQDLLALGSRTFDLMVEYLRARGTRSLQELPIAYADAAGVPELRLRNCRIAHRGRSKAAALVGIFNFKIAYTSDERVEELFTVAVDAEGRVRPDVPTRLAHARPFEGRPPSVGPKLERMFRAAEERAALHANESAAEREREILARMHREISRLVTYYQEMIEELPFGPIEGEGAAAHLRAELERKVAEEVEAHRLHVAITPVNCCLVAAPEARYTLRLASGHAAASLELRRDLHTGALELPHCSACARETAEVGLCRAGHIACPECLSPCAACGQEVCARCGIQPCPVCGRTLCATCKAVCPQCQGWTCAEHLSTCPVCGAAVCGHCQARCAGCDTLQCAAHLRGCAECDDLFCDKCAAACSGCGAVVCREHGIACAVCAKVCCPRCGSRCAICGQALCRAHVASCGECGKAICGAHGAACVQCGRTVCAEHGRACEECNKPVCRECAVTCTVCGAARCYQHRLACAVCGRALCREHSEVCAACGAPVCSEHAQGCAGCAQRVCEGDLEACSICGQTYCDACRQDETTCVFCAGLERAERVPEARVRAIRGLGRRLQGYADWRMVENASCRIYLGEKGLGLAVVVTDKRGRLLKAEELGWLSSLLGL